MLKKWKGCYFSYVMTFFFFYYCLAAFGSVLSVYLTQIGIGITDLSFIISSSSLFGLLLTPAAGYLSDRTGKPRQVCMLFMTGAGCFAMLFSAARQIGLLFLLNGLAMSFLGSAQPVLERIAGSVHYRYGVLRIWGTIGYAAGAQTAGLILQHLSSRALFLSVLAAACLASVGISGAEDPIREKEEQTPSQASKTKTAAGFRATALALFSNHRYVLYLAITFLMLGCSMVNMTYVPVLLTELGVAAGNVGRIISVSTLVEIPLILFSDRFMDRFSIRKLLLFTCAITITEYLVFGLSHSVLWVTAVIILLKAVGSTLFMMISLKAVRSLLPREMITTGLSVVNTSSSIGMILIQNAGGVFIARTSLSSFYLVMAGVICFVTVLSVFLKTDNSGNVFG